MARIKEFFGLRRYLRSVAAGLKTEKGLTLVETSVSIAIFGFLITFCLGIFIFAGRVYYKGIYESRTQEVVRNVVGNVAESIRTSGVEILEIDNITLLDTTLTSPAENHINDIRNREVWRGYCVGNIKYSYRLNTQLSVLEDNSDDYDGVEEEVFIKSRDSDTPCDPSALSFDAEPFSDPVTSSQIELLHDGMRIVNFSIDKVDGFPDLYLIQLKIAYGGDPADEDLEKAVFAVKNDDMTTTIYDPNSIGGSTSNPYNAADEETWIHRCKTGETFCSVIDLSTRAYQKVI